MKKLLVLTIILFLSGNPALSYEKQVFQIDPAYFAAHFSADMSPEDFRLNFVKYVMDQNQINSLENFAKWLPQNLTYRKDRQDQWSSPMETIVRGYGDCEDLAALSAAILTELGFQPRLIGFKQPHQDHIIIVFEKNKRLHMIDNTRLIMTTARNMDDIARFLHASLKAEYIVEVDAKTRKSQILFSKARLLELAQAKNS